MWNRTSFNFWKARARWPGLNLGKPLRFCAPEVLQNLASTRPPVMGVLGDGRHGGRGGTAASADCARPLASFGSFSTWKRNSPRRAKPCKTARRVVAQASFSCPCGAIHLLVSYGWKAKEPGGGGEPPPYRVLLTMLVPRTAPSSAPVCALGHLSLSPLSLRDISP